MHWFSRAEVVSPRHRRESGANPTEAEKKKERKTRKRKKKRQKEDLLGAPRFDCICLGKGGSRRWRRNCSRFFFVLWEWGKLKRFFLPEKKKPPAERGKNRFGEKKKTKKECLTPIQSNTNGRQSEKRKKYEPKEEGKKIARKNYVIFFLCSVECLSVMCCCNCCCKKKEEKVFLLCSPNHRRDGGCYR